ncbi:hypothetical protein BDFB_012173 [Asbolus verrucosus]|uniref:Uncharacterized protein n=1 Tax=Asbolus verrucosus TaxID=1661398 RepID=A0A482V452_ASBVE|nr:hypothetical protein BDFB_012173 [Asbolus verrucosus]
MFFCGPEKEAKKRVERLGDLKQLVEAIENKMLVPCSLVCCPVCCPPCLQDVVKEAPTPPQPPDTMVCYKIEKKEKRKASRNTKKQEQPKRTKRAKSRELRGGILYGGCDCEKRYGLQDDCPRTGCHGSPECLTKPDPICGPSEFSNGKHLGKKFGIDHKVVDVVASGGQAQEDDCTVHYNCYPATIKC